MANGDVVWSIPPGGALSLVAADYNLTERLATAGYDRLYVELDDLPAVGDTYTSAFAAPCTPELV